MLKIVASTMFLSLLVSTANARILYQGKVSETPCNSAGNYKPLNQDWQKMPEGMTCVSIIDLSTRKEVPLIVSTSQVDSDSTPNEKEEINHLAKENNSNKQPRTEILRKKKSEK